MFFNDGLLEFVPHRCNETFIYFDVASSNALHVESTNLFDGDSIELATWIFYFFWMTWEPEEATKRWAFVEEFKQFFSIIYNYVKVLKSIHGK